jgi:hypothetical protein
VVACCTPLGKRARRACTEGANRGDATRWLLATAVAGIAAVSLAAQAPAPDAAPATTRVWIGQYARYEEFLRTAPIERVEKIPVGVTHPERAYFAAGALAKSATVKHLPPARRSGYFESYKSEIAAYELDRLLGLDMVPVTVERRVGADLAAVQLWIEDCRLLKQVDQASCPNKSEWAKQVLRQRIFDCLVANIDRNSGNLLVDPGWNLVLIDHSRAFATDKMPFEKQLTRIDRKLFERLKALDEAALMQRVRPWLLNDGSARGILKRRDRIVKHFESLAREKGEPAVFEF